MVVDTFLAVGQMLGTEPAMARAIAVQEAKRVCDIDFTPLLAGNAVTDAPMTATDLGKALGMTAREVNKALVAEGLQVKGEEGWKPTAKAEGLYTINPYKSEHSEHTGYRILWNPKVAELLRGKLN